MCISYAHSKHVVGIVVAVGVVIILLVLLYERQKEGDLRCTYGSCIATAVHMRAYVRVPVNVCADAQKQQLSDGHGHTLDVSRRYPERRLAII